LKKPLFLRRYLNVLGGALGLAGVIFVGIRLYTDGEQLNLSELDFSVWVCLSFLALLYGFANVLLARAWWHQLKIFGLDAGWSSTLKIYGLSQLAKYVPGNIFHLAGRQALAMAAGLQARPLIKSAAWELGSIAVAGAAFGVLVLPLIWTSLNQFVAVSVFALLLVVIFVTLTTAISKSAAVALLWQVLFLSISGLVFVGTLLLVDHDSVYPLIPCLCGSFVVAWLLGLLTPGAPAGVGVREAVLLYLLEGLIAPQALLLSIVFGRLVTVLGDLVFFTACAVTPLGRETPDIQR